MIIILKSMIILLAIIFKFVVIENVINAYGKAFYIFRSFKVGTRAQSAEFSVSVFVSCHLQ